MSYIEIIMLALALSIDACVVSFTYGLLFNQNRIRNALLLALFTGVFQGIMPIVGYILTGFVKTFIEPYGKFIIFVIFMFLGVKFIKEAFEKKQTPLCIGITCLLLIGVATSIDALAVGITFALIAPSIGIGFSVLLIGVITFALSLFGVIIGNKFGAKYKSKAELAGGIILVLIGVKILLEHLGVLA